MAPYHNHNDDRDDEEVYEGRENWNGDERRRNYGKEEWERYNRENEATKSAWSLSPQSVSTYLAVFGIVLGAGWTFSDFRVTLNDLQTRQTALTERMNMLDKREADADNRLEARISQIDNSGTRQLVGTEAQIRAMREQVETLKEALDSVNGAIQQHNESMYDLYKKQNPGKAFPQHHELPYVPRKQIKLEPVVPGKTNFTERN